MKIVETDNFGGDYPDEKFLPIPDLLTRKDCEEICEIINNTLNLHATYPRYWKVVDDNYKLQPGFTP